jgi:serine/threonine protein kinase
MDDHKSKNKVNNKQDRVIQQPGDSGDVSDSGIEAETNSEFIASPALGELSTKDEEAVTTWETPVENNLGQRIPIAGTLPGFEFLSELGKGGMGVVYKARHLKLNRVVAVKMMLSEQFSKMELARFIFEAEAIAGIRDENVVQVYECGEFNGKPYMVLEYCEKGTLSFLLKKQSENNSSVEDIHHLVTLVHQVIKGVSAAHKKGIIHRDLKPGNVLVNENNILKVADFGLVKLVDKSEMTHTGAVMGTPAYMSPEQAKGESKSVNARADVWSLGVMMYEAMTGRRPFDGRTFIEIQDKIRNQDPVPPRRLRKSIPGDLELICLKALSKDPNERYASATDFSEDLEHYFNFEPISVKASGIIKKTLKWTRRNRLVFRLGILGLVVSFILSLLVIQWVDSMNQREKDNKASANVIDSTTKEKDKIQKALYYNSLRQAHAEAGFTKRLGILEDESKCPKNFRNVPWNVLRRLCLDSQSLRMNPSTALSVSADGRYFAVASDSPKIGVKVCTMEDGIEHAFFDSESPVLSVSFASSVDMLAFVDSKGMVRVRDVAGKSKQVEIKSPEPLSSVLVSPDGSWVAASLAGSPIGAPKKPNPIKVWKLSKDGPVQLELQGHDGPVSCLAVSGDGKYLASASADKTVRTWEMPGCLPGKIFSHDAWVKGVAFSTDGSTIASGDSLGIIKCWFLSGEQKNSWSGMAAHVNSLLFLPDGKLVSSHGGGGDRGICQARMWNAPKGDLQLALDMENSEVLFLGYDKVHKQLLGMDRKGLLRFWDIYAREEKQIISAHHFPKVGYAVAFHPEGNEIATAGGVPRGPFGGEIKIWDSVTGVVRKTLGGGSKVLSLCYADNGKVLISGAADGTVTYWDSKTGTEKFSHKGYLDEVRFIAVSDEKRMVATGGKEQGVILWNLDSGSEIKKLGRHDLNHDPRHPLAGVFSPDGSTLYTSGHDSMIRAWDLGAFSEKHTVKLENSIFALAISSDGKTLYSSEPDKIRAWDIQADLVQTKSAEHQGLVYGLALGNSFLCSGSSLGTVKIWEVDGLNEVFEMNKPSSGDQGKGKFEIKGLAVSGDGKCLAGIGTDGNLRLWK